MLFLKALIPHLLPFPQLLWDGESKDARSAFSPRNWFPFKSGMEERKKKERRGEELSGEKGRKEHFIT